MKTTTADYQYRIHCIRIVPNIGTPVYITDHPRSILISGNLYSSDYGYEFTGQDESTAMNAGVIDLSGIIGLSGITYAKIASGVFDNARVYVFATTWTNPIEDEEELGIAIFGRTELRDQRHQVEMMMLIDALGQTVGINFTPGCQKKYGGTEFAGCKSTPTVVTGTITHVTNNYTFRDSNRTQAFDFFGEGFIGITSGSNATTEPLEIKSYAADGSIVLHSAFHYPVTVGSTYSMTSGCRRNLAACIGKNNVVNFGGFSFVPTEAIYSQTGSR